MLYLSLLIIQPVIALWALVWLSEGMLGIERELASAVCTGYIEQMSVYR
jgi:hypothetical protein